MFEKILGEVRGIFNIITIIDLIISIIFILTGIIFISSPSTSNLVVSIMLGILLISNGVSSLIAYFKRESIVLYNNNLIYGIILILIGILSIFLRNFLLIVLGIYFLLSGIQKINYGIFFKKFNESSWLLTFTVGVLFIIIGIITLVTDVESVVKSVGICLFGFGTINIINTILLRRRSKYFLA